MPQLTLFDGSATNIMIPSDATYHTIASSGYLQHPVLSFEVGILYAPGSNGAINLEPNMSDWEIIGLATGSYNKVDLKAAGNCANSPARTFTASRFQVLAIPDNMGIEADNNCSTSVGDCCSQHPSCIEYQCTANPSLPRNVHASSPVCTVPPAPEPLNSSFYTITPCRVYDSRKPPNTPLAFNAPMQLPVGGVCGIPTAAKAVALNLTAIHPAADVSIQMYPGNQPPPPGKPTAWVRSMPESRAAAPSRSGAEHVRPE